MRELGAELSRVREELGLDLDELEARTKIRKRYLVALEDGDWSVLPGDVYARGFVRSYAEAMGLDGRALLRQYTGDEAGHRSDGDRKPTAHGKGTSSNGHGTASQVPASSAGDERHRSTQGASVTPGGSTQPKTALPPTFSASTYTSRPTYGKQRRDKQTARVVQRRARASRGVAGQIIAVAGILVVLGGGLYIINHTAHRSTGSPLPPTGVNPPLTTNNSGGHNTVAGNVYGQGGGLIATNSNATAIPNNGAVSNSAGNGGGGSQSQTTQVTLHGMSGGKINYLVTTNQTMSVTLSAPITDLWVMTTADGAVVDGAGGEVIPKGQSKPFTASHAISFHIGNVPAASFVVNGSAVPLPKVNQVVDIVFTKVQSGSTGP